VPVHSKCRQNTDRISHESINADSDFEFSSKYSG